MISNSVVAVQSHWGYVETGYISLLETSLIAKIDTDLLVTGDLDIGGGITLTGGITIDGDVTLGDAVTDTITIKGSAVLEQQLTSNIVYAVGQTVFYFRSSLCYFRGT